MGKAKSTRIWRKKLLRYKVRSWQLRIQVSNESFTCIFKVQKIMTRVVKERLKYGF
jgi:hypothetical protein